MDSEKKIQEDIFGEVGGRRRIRLFKNPVGVGYSGQRYKLTNYHKWQIRRALGLPLAARFTVLINPRVIRYGLAPGSSDLIGFKKVTITPDMVGKDIAQFIAIECKRADGTPKPRQKNFMSVVNRYGGLAGIARSVLQAFNVIKEDPENG